MNPIFILATVLMFPSLNMSSAFNVSTADSGYSPGYTGPLEFVVDIQCTGEIPYDMFVGDVIDVSIYSSNSFTQVLEEQVFFVFKPDCHKRYVFQRDIVAQVDENNVTLIPNNITLLVCMKPDVWNTVDCLRREHAPTIQYNLSGNETVDETRSQRAGIIGRAVVALLVWVVLMVPASFIAWRLKNLWVGVFAAFMVAGVSIVIYTRI